MIGDPQGAGFKVTDEQVLAAVHTALRELGSISGRGILSTGEIEHYGKLPISRSTLNRRLHRLEELGRIRRLSAWRSMNVWELA